MKYSIIIPTLNEEKLIDSVLKQFEKFKELSKEQTEIIISDGGSSDKTIEICKKYTDFILIKKTEEIENIPIGRNRGGFAANGDILIFINADVFVEDIEVMIKELNYFIESPQYCAMTGKVKVFKNEEVLKDKLFHNFFNFYFRLLNKFGIGMGRGECQIVKRDSFYKINGYNPEMFAGEDMDLYKRLTETGKIYFSDKLVFRESPRRYRKQGYIKTMFRWTMNGISALQGKKSFSKQWEEVR